MGTSLSDYSQTPASNDMANYFQTGMAPSKVKNAGWDIMADMADYIVGGYTSGGTANAQTLTQTRPLTALVAGLRLTFIPGFTNTGAMTFAPDGLTAKNVFANGVAAIAGMVVLNVPATLVYDGTQWNLMNPQRSTGSFTLTLTGVTSGSGTVNYSIGTDGKTIYGWVTADITGTSNATSFGGTGLPTNLQLITHALYILVRVMDNGAIQGTPGVMSITNSGTVTFYKDLNATGWTSTGTKGFANTSNFTYQIS